MRPEEFNVEFSDEPNPIPEVEPYGMGVTVEIDDRDFDNELAFES